MNTIAPGGAIPEKPDKMFEFKKVRLNVQGMMASAREYEALKTRDGVEVSIYEGPWAYNDKITREDCLQSRRKGGDKLYYEIAEFFYEAGIEKWDGFCKSNPNVLDGYAFSFEAETVDGKKISARGSNSFPSNYGKLEDYLWDLCH